MPITSGGGGGGGSGGGGAGSTGGGIWRARRPIVAGSTPSSSPVQSQAIPVAVACSEAALAIGLGLGAIFAAVPPSSPPGVVPARGTMVQAEAPPLPAGLVATRQPLIPAVLPFSAAAIVHAVSGEPPTPFPGLASSAAGLPIAIPPFSPPPDALIATGEAPPPFPGITVVPRAPTPAPTLAPTTTVQASESPTPATSPAITAIGQPTALTLFARPLAPTLISQESAPSYSGTILAGIGQPIAVPGFARPPSGTTTTSEPSRDAPSSILVSRAPAGLVASQSIATTVLVSGAESRASFADFGSVYARSSASLVASIPAFARPSPSSIVQAEAPPPHPGLTISANGLLTSVIASSGYYVYSNTGIADPINYTTPIATILGFSDTTWTSSVLAAPGTWKLGVRAFNGNGVEQNLDCAVTIVLDAFGNDVTNRPLPPTGLRAFATPGGSIRVEFWYPLTRGATAPLSFNVYLGTGGTPNYTTPAATILYSAGLFNTFQVNLGPLTNGTTYAVGVRAQNASGEEQNTYFVLVTADTTGPAAVTGLSATAIV